MSNIWKDKDTLRVMTEKFNKSVEIVLTLENKVQDTITQISALKEKDKTLEELIINNNNTIQDRLQTINQELSKRYLKTETYSQSEINTKLDLKANLEYTNQELDKRYLKTQTLSTEEITNKLKTKVDTTKFTEELKKIYQKTETYSKDEINRKIQEVVGSAPDALNTLKEISEALGNDNNFAATITNKLSEKVDKVNGKTLSTNDYTNEEKNKLAGIDKAANKYIHPNTHPASIIEETPTKRFVTDTEKTNWNKVSKKLDIEVANTTFATKQEISAAGYGDMLKATYDTNGNGVVDRAESVNGIVKALNLSSQVQTDAYRKSVIALCDLDNSNTNRYSFSQGTLNFRRTNGLTTVITAIIDVQKMYNVAGMLGSVVTLGSNKDCVKLCTFIYNGKIYGGVEFFYDAANHSEVEFIGNSNFKIFGLDYYNTNSNKSINQEVSSSISFTSGVIKRSDIYNNGFTIYHSGNDHTHSSLNIFGNNEIVIGKGFNQNNGDIIINHQGALKPILKYHLRNGMGSIYSDLKIKNLEAENIYTKSETDNKFAILNRENLFTQNQKFEINKKPIITLYEDGGNANSIEWRTHRTGIKIGGFGFHNSGNNPIKAYIGFGERNFEEPVATFHPNGDLKAKNKIYSNNKEVALKEEVYDKLTLDNKLRTKISSEVVSNTEILKGANEPTNNPALLGNLSDLRTTNKNNLVAAINEAFQRGNERKSKLVEILIAKGISCSTRDSWDVLLKHVNTLRR